MEDYFHMLKCVFLNSRSPFGIFFFFILGCFWGSFLNVCIYRLPFGRSIVLPRSSCPNCGQPVDPWFNIPILSFFVLKGKCFYCYNEISLRYPFIELITGLLCAFLFNFYGGLNREFVYHFLFTNLLTIIFYIDLDHWLILDCVTLPGIFVGILGKLFIHREYELALDFGWIVKYLPFKNTFSWNTFFDSILGVIIGYFLFTFIAIIGSLILRQEAMGGGDIKFAGLIGAFLGSQIAVVSFLLSFFLGFLYALPLLLIRRKRGKDPVPFGTFMALAAFIAMISGPQLLGWLLNWQVLLVDL